LSLWQNSVAGTVAQSAVFEHSQYVAVPQVEHGLYYYSEQVVSVVLVLPLHCDASVVGFSSVVAVYHSFSDVSACL